MYRVVDLRSDTVTKPSSQMREVIANAEVGDDVFGEDPTVKELENYFAKLVQKDCALFVPTATMANLIAIMCHCWQRGAEVLLGDQSHIHLFEQGGIATIANVHSRTLTNKCDGTFSIDELKSKIRTNVDSHVPNTTLICLENTHNVCNGSPLPIDFIDDVCRIAKQHNIAVHVDGARLLNASAKTGESPDRIVKNCDSVTLCLSKGLGCPAGSLIAGSRQFINRAIRCRKVLGGGMRQSGVLAAAGIWALKTNVDRMKDDHKHALMIAKAIANKANSNIIIDPNVVQTNIAYVDVNPLWMTAPQFSSRLKIVSNEEKSKLGDRCVIIKMDPESNTKLRFVTHLDISYEDTLLAIQKLEFVIDNEGNK